MATSKSPASSSAKPPHWTQAVKDRAEQAETRAAQAEAFNEQLAAQIKALQAKFEQLEGVGAMPGSAIAAPAPEVTLPPDDDEYHEEFDHLRWITDEHDEIHMISRDSAVLRCPSGENGSVGKVGANAWRKDYLHALRLRWWKNRHLNYGGVDAADKQSNENANKKWHYYIVTPEDGRVAFPDYHPKRDLRKQQDIDHGMEAPGYAIIYPHEFRGLSRRGQLLGKKRKASNCKTREFVRMLLQHGCGGNMYFLTDLAEYRANPLIDMNKPNPYEMNVGYLSVESRSVGGLVR